MFLKYLFFLLIFASYASAEIISITISFNPPLCNEKCAEMLVNQFSRIPTVSKVSVNRPAGIINIQLKEKKGFSYMPFNRAMQYIGLSGKIYWIKAKGHVTLNKGRYFFVSEGDGTSFALINTLVPSASTMVNPLNYQGEDRSLTPEIKSQLDEGIRLNKKATIYGQLYFPERAPPLILVIESLEWSK